MKPVDGAPAYLVRAIANGKIKNGRVLLARLLCDIRMKSAWHELARHAKRDHDWQRVWDAVAYAKLKSKSAARSHEREWPSDEEKKYKALAEELSGLAARIENGPLDVPGYKLLPDDVLRALGVPNPQRLDERSRAAAARPLLLCWPTAPELLREMATIATARAKLSKERARPVSRATGDMEARTFVFHLGGDFKDNFGRALLGVVAHIADVTFQRPNVFSRSFVQSALKGV